MALMIRELLIRAVVQEGEVQVQSRQPDAASAEKLVTEAVERTLDTLREREDR